jgi:hypothetical protein
MSGITLNSNERPVMDWQPIETAPRDGTLILVYGDPYSSGGCPYAIARWEKRTVEFWEDTDRKTKTLITRDESDWDVDGEVFPELWTPIIPPSK